MTKTKRPCLRCDKMIKVNTHKRLCDRCHLDINRSVEHSYIKDAKIPDLLDKKGFRK